jgi:hypothetical protein
VEELKAQVYKLEHILMQRAFKVVKLFFKYPLFFQKHTFHVVQNIVQINSESVMRTMVLNDNIKIVAALMRTPYS